MIDLSLFGRGGSGGRILRAAVLLQVVGLFPGTASAEGLREAMTTMESTLGRLTAAVFRRDLAEVEAAATALADAPRPDLGYRLWLLGRLGDDAPRFRQYGQSLTAAAEALARTAREGQAARLYPAYREVLEPCLGCHRAFQARLAGDRQ